MPNRINRVDQKESYNITVSWLDDFAKSLNKNAQIVEIFRNQNREKFVGQTGLSASEIQRRISDNERKHTLLVNSNENRSKHNQKMYEFVKTKLGNTVWVIYDCKSDTADVYTL